MNYTGVREVEVVVIGAGQAGLAAAFHLRRVGGVPDRDFVVLDHSPRPGGAWQFRWPTLTYDKVHGMHALPGMELTGADPQRPSSEVIGAYFDSYEQTFGLRVRRPVSVTAVREGGEGPPWTEPAKSFGALRERTSAGRDVGGGLCDAGADQCHRDLGPAVLAAVSRAGDVRRPSAAHFPVPGAGGLPRGSGSWWWAAARPAVQQLMEIAPVAAATTWVTRRPPVFREGPFGEDAGPGRGRPGGGAGPAGAAAAERGERDRAADDRGDPAGPRERRTGAAAALRTHHAHGRGLGRRTRRRGRCDPLGDGVPRRHRPSRPAAAARAGRRYPDRGHPHAA